MSGDLSPWNREGRMIDPPRCGGGLDDDNDTPQEGPTCPFCGGNEIDTVSVSGGFYVKCQTCPAMGPIHDSPENAMETWEKQSRGDF